MHTLLPGHNIYLVELPLLIVLVSLVYSATRFEEWGAILREALRWGLRLAAFLVAIGIVLFVLHRYESVVFALITAFVLVTIFIASNTSQRSS